MDTRWKHPFSAILAGPSNCGKSYFIKNVLDNAKHTLSVMPENIVWCYSCWQPLYKELLCKYPFINFVEGLPDAFDDDSLFPTNKVNMIIIDDLMNSACESDEIEKAFTKYVHHRNLSIMYIVQNVFCQGKKSRTINLNTKYMVLFKNPRDKLQIATLARQMYPGKAQFFLEAFEDATKRPYGYLVVDLNASTPEAYRLRTGLFPPDWPAVYTLKRTTAGYKKR
ncbi:TPA_asm: FtsK [Terrapene box turtle adintovirus]|uniref:FtsK n=1 Tax=Terrapene box turtle adintovirus TaxID=2597808 RepID=A0A5H3CKT6_9VIRU|nr:FtsK [Terrapene box turtle adintovirus]DAC80300.1 TPA_asm: FtsK [Terrapene box turtle adintovirus]